VIPAAVEYVRPSSVEEALEALAQPDAKVLAGGQSLLPVMKLRVVRPSVVVDVGRLDLRGVDLRGNELRLGALTTWSELASAREIATPALAALADCAADVGDLQVRNRGTIGGSLAHADPASDLPAVVLALGARIAVRSAAGERDVAATDFFLGPFTTALGPSELITEVVIPIWASSGSAYAKVEHPASGFALAGAAAVVHADGESSVAVTGVGGQAALLPAGRDPLDGLADTEVYGDRFASAEYRHHLAGVVARRSLERARQRLEEER
jgi:aerobic carbon-monoxide dehydrogenase medium subunit